MVKHEKVRKYMPNKNNNGKENAAVILYLEFCCLLGILQWRIDALELFLQ
jgi:hypothetical protein